MDKARQYHLMLLMHPDHADLGVFVRAFMEHAKTSEHLQERIDSFATRVSDKAMPKPEQDYLGFLSGSFMRESKHPQKLTYHHYKRDNIMSHMGCIIWATHNALNSLVQQSSDSAGLLEKLPQSTDYDSKLSNYIFRQNAGMIFNNGHSFIRNPRIIISDAILTMKQAMIWLCMHTTSPQDIVDQMKAALEPTLKDPRSGKMISPIEMLGYGNNGYIGEVIGSSFPMYINGKPIIRNANTEDRAIIDEAFVENWFDRDLKIGGCPVLAHRSRVNGLYMDFSRFFVETAERVLQKYQALELKKSEICKSNLISCKGLLFFNNYRIP